MHVAWSVPEFGVHTWLGIKAFNLDSTAARRNVGPCWRAATHACSSLAETLATFAGIY